MVTMMKKSSPGSTYVNCLMVRYSVKFANDFRTYVKRGLPVPKESTAVPVIAELFSDDKNNATSAISFGSINLGSSCFPFDLKAVR